MATRRERISAAFLRVTAKLNDLFSTIGTLSSLSTTNKSSVVAAINEVKSIADVAIGGGVSINDTVTVTTSTWSSQKIKNEITADIAGALEGEDLSDLASQVTANAQADAGFVSVAAAQSFSAVQQTQGRTNLNAANGIEVGDTDHDFVAEINSALSF